MHSQSCCGFLGRPFFGTAPPTFNKIFTGNKYMARTRCRAKDTKLAIPILDTSHPPRHEPRPWLLPWPRKSQNSIDLLLLHAPARRIRPTQLLLESRQSTYQRFHLAQLHRSSRVRPRQPVHLPTRGTPVCASGTPEAIPSIAGLKHFIVERSPF